MGFIELVLLQFSIIYTSKYFEGVSADGVYQAQKFKEMMSQGKPKDATFIGKVAWDPSHWFDLAVTDVKEGKTGTSKDFLSNFIEKTNTFSGILNRGKGYNSFF